ncbi:MAG: DUF2088 domain-containing protein [Bacteroidetes bacterium]|nr:DUF2088 domain-containing protein [Bacteroidota bacterium]
MVYYSEGSGEKVFTKLELKTALHQAFEKIGPRKRVLIIPPDITRYHSRAGEITEIAYNYYGDAVKAVMPALGTHVPMTESEIKKMFGTVPLDLFRDHDWRNDIVTLGEIPSETLEKISEGKVSYSWPVQVNKLLLEGEFDLMLSIGQVVPHEVIGMANYTKNIFVGTGGQDGINKSHYLGAAYGMERIMGRADNPVRYIMDEAYTQFGKDLPIVFIQTVIGTEPSGELAMKGLYISEERTAFEQASDLALEVNFTMLDKPLKTVVVYLDPEEFRSTWLGNKSIYRTRMVLADGGHLIVLAPGVSTFGEDPEIDKLIRKYGYKGTEKVLSEVETQDDLKQNLSAAAHLIHGSSDGRFSITYCPGGLSKEEVEGAGYKYGDIEAMMELYKPQEKQDGYYQVAGKEVYFIGNPALGLWACRDRFNA